MRFFLLLFFLVPGFLNAGGSQSSLLGDDEAYYTPYGTLTPAALRAKGPPTRGGTERLNAWIERACPDSSSNDDAQTTPWYACLTSCFCCCCEEDD